MGRLSPEEMTTYAPVYYTGDGTTTSFAIPFDYLNRSDVHVTIADTATTDYSWTSPSSIRLSAAPPMGAQIIIRRLTSIDTAVSGFAPGNLSGADLRRAFSQIIFNIQERGLMLGVSPGAAPPDNFVTGLNDAGQLLTGRPTMANILATFGSISRSLALIFVHRPVFVMDYLSDAQRQDVLSYTGALDLKATVQAIIDANPGRRLIFTAGKWTFRSRLTIPMGTTIEGEGWGELPISTMNHGTIFLQDYLAEADPYGIYIVGSGVTIRNLEIQQTQPALVTGWVPLIGPWAIYAFAWMYHDDGGHRPTIEHVMLRNVWDGINFQDIRGGYIRDVVGQPLHRGIRITGNGDEPHLADIRLGWTYWTGFSAVMSWRLAHAEDFSFGRVDNPKATNLFSFGAWKAYRFFYDNTHGVGDYDGITAAGAFANIEADACDIGVALEDNPEVSFTNLHVSPGYGAPTAVSIFTYGIVNPSAAYGNLRLTVIGGVMPAPPSTAMNFTFAPSGTPSYPQYIKLIGVRIGPRVSGTFDAAHPAIYAVPGVSIYAPDITVDNVTDPAAVINGGGLLLPSRTELDVNGTVYAKSISLLDGDPHVTLENSSGPADQRLWHVGVDTAGALHVAASNDAGTESYDAIKITRNGVGPGVAQFPNAALQVETTTVAALASLTGAGLIVAVSDGAASLALGATITGGGTTRYLVWNNGSGWTVIGK